MILILKIFVSNKRLHVWNLTDLIGDYFCALFRPAMFNTVLDIVGIYIPTLEALNLEGNRLQNIEKLNILNQKCPNLKILYIGGNKVSTIAYDYVIILYII